MRSSDWLLVCSIGIIRVQVVFGLKCRTEHDLKTIEEFDNIVRNCLKTEWGGSGNNGNDNRKDNRNIRRGAESGGHNSNGSPSSNAFRPNGDSTYNKDRFNKELSGNNRSNEWNNQSRKGSGERGSSTNRGYSDDSNRSKSTFEIQREKNEFGNSRQKSNSSDDDDDDDYYDEYDYGETTSDVNKSGRKPEINSKQNDNDESVKRRPNSDRNNNNNNSAKSGGNSGADRNSQRRNNGDENSNRGNRHKTSGLDDRFDGGHNEGSRQNFNFQDRNMSQGNCRRCGNNGDRYNNHRHNVDQPEYINTNNRGGSPKRDQNGNHGYTGPYQGENSDEMERPNYNHGYGSYTGPSRHPSNGYGRYDHPELGQTDVWNHRNGGYQPPVQGDTNPFFTNNYPPHRINNRGENYSNRPGSDGGYANFDRYGDIRYSQNSSGRYGNSRNETRIDNNDRNNGKSVSSLMDVEPCTIHCIFRQFRMVNGDSRLDKQRVADTLTRRARDPNLKQFIWQSVHHCFERNNLGNKDQCEGAKIFAMCMEDAGRMNCEDWDFNKKFSDTHPNQRPDFNTRPSSRPIA